MLDVPIVGADPDEVARLVERHRGRTSGNHLRRGPPCRHPDAHIDRYRELAAKGVDTVFVSLPNLSGPAEIEQFAGILAAFG